MDNRQRRGLMFPALKNSGSRHDLSNFRSEPIEQAFHKFRGRNYPTGGDGYLDGKASAGRSGPWMILLLLVMPTGYANSAWAQPPNSFSDVESYPDTPAGRRAEELVAVLLIVWRRTCVLGAMVAAGVMLNVLMLNLCYDVPVKLYSMHLLLMSIMIILPDASRLLSVFVLNRPTQAVNLAGVWQARWAWWTRLIVKSVVVGLFVLLPVGFRLVTLPAQWKEYVQAMEEPRADSHLLIDRGFRWINEVPFNR